MTIEAALSTAMETIPDCIAAGYVDMETGMLLGANTSDPESADVLDSLAIAVANLFQGRGVKNLTTRDLGKSRCFLTIG